jgi:hypothetical protein
MNLERVMAHEVSVQIPKLSIGKSDFQISIKKNGAKIGELLISQGNIEWWPSGNSRKKKRLKWSEFEYFFEEYGKTVKD